MTIFLKKVTASFFFMIALLPLAHAQLAAEAQHAKEHFQEIFKNLNLTDAQKQALEANKEQHRAGMQKTRQEMKDARQALQQELMKTQLDNSRINALHGRIKELMSQMEDAKLASILAVRSILTQEQFTKFVEMMHKHKGDHD